MDITVQIKKTEGYYSVSLVGHNINSVAVNKRDILSAIGEMMDSKCASGKCDCKKS